MYDNLQALLDSLPDYAKDIKLNVSSLLANADKHLTDEQMAGVLYAATLTLKNEVLIRAVTSTVKPLLSEQHLWAVKAAVTIMAMNNIYYRFTHLVNDDEYIKLPARLRMNVMANPGVDKMDFELYAITVSIINGCGKCIESHAKTLEQHGVSRESIQMCARIAAVMHALLQVTMM